MQITGKAEVITEKLERLLNNLNQVTQPEKMEKIYTLVENATHTFARLNDILTTNSRNLALTLQRSARIAAQLDSMTAAMNQSAQEVRQLIVSDTLKEIIVNARAISEEIKKARLVDLVKQLALVVQRTNSILTRVEHDLGQGSQTFNESMKELRTTLEYLNEVSQMLSEDPSVLLRGTKPGNIPDRKLEK
jgi:phospholipid/cholesterol/gamma-HCH transport system substrate-binding protein